MNLESWHPFWQVFLVAFKHPITSLIIAFVLSVIIGFWLHFCIRVVGRTLPGGMVLDENPSDSPWIELQIFVRNSFLIPFDIPGIIWGYLLIVLISLLSVFLWMIAIILIIGTMTWAVISCWRWDRWEKRHLPLS